MCSDDFSEGPADDHHDETRDGVAQADDFVIGTRQPLDDASGTLVIVVVGCFSPVIKVVAVACAYWAFNEVSH